MKKRKIAVFDFDGTLTTKDTLFEFIKFTCGCRRFCLGFVLFLPLMVLMKLGVYPNWKCKQQFFSWFYKGMDYEHFKHLGNLFADRGISLLRKDIADKVKEYRSSKIDLYIVSASIEEWVIPVARCLNVVNVLGTKVEVDTKNKLTGYFSTKNCYGQEKVNRLMEKEPDRDKYYLYAYGDSNGDKEMLAFADEGFWI
jgi:HAD superfamily hydrolase (TIGR01490 family)